MFCSILFHLFLFLSLSVCLYVSLVLQRFWPFFAWVSLFLFLFLLCFFFTKYLLLFCDVVFSDTTLVAYYEEEWPIFSVFTWTTPPPPYCSKLHILNSVWLLFLLELYTIQQLYIKLIFNGTSLNLSCYSIFSLSVQFKFHLL